MFKFFTKADKKTANKAKTRLESEAIASPKTETKYHYNANKSFTPVDVVLPNQAIPGKFNYHSATWKYIQNYLNVRIEKLHLQNENQKLSIERTQLLRGQLKEIKFLLQHINHLAGVTPSPIKSSLEIDSTDGGFTYE